MKDEGFQSLGDLFSAKKEDVKKAPAYQWQEIALKVISILNVPQFKKSSIFKVCRDNNKIVIERCLADTRELCKGKEKWKYFLKVISEEKNKNNT